MDKRERAEWSRPELVVLARRVPEEAVLASCKLASPSFFGHSVFFRNRYIVACDLECEMSVQS